MKRLLKYILSTIIICSVLLTLTACANSVENHSHEVTSPTVLPTVIINGDEYSCTVNGNKVDLLTKCYSYKGHVYFPVVDVFPHFGYSIGWDSELSAVTLLKDGIVSFMFPSRNNIWVGPVEYIFDHRPLTVSGRAYMSCEMFTAFTGGNVIVETNPEEYKNGLSILYSERTDAFRLPGNSFCYGGNVYVFDGVGMELPLIPEDSAIKYASTLNTVAESLDTDINVYNIVVPTAAEFYAPLSHYPNHLYGIQNVYKNLSERVIPINVYDTLAEHAAEPLYFKTDHHWTQRGAYYAYKEFMSYKNINVPELESFASAHSNNFVGSFASFAKGTTAGEIMKRSPELLEKYIPKYADKGYVYSNPSLTNYSAGYSAVITNNNTYSCFIGGDNPIIVYDTNANSDKTLVIIKESYGNPFATWAMNDFKRVCVVDPRRFNGFNGNNTRFNLNEFCNTVGATDVLFINYPIAVISAPIRNSILKMK